MKHIGDESILSLYLLYISLGQTPVFQKDLHRKTACVILRTIQRY